MDSYLTSLFLLSRSLVKYALHWWYGTCEIERVCGGAKQHSPEMSLRLARAVFRSKQLQVLKKLVFFHRPFSVKLAVDNIVSNKRIMNSESKRYLLANMSLSCRDLRVINICVTALEKLRKTTYNYSTQEHALLLARLWTGLFGSETRFPGPVSEDWSLLAGFQGKDPSTDFRGMGLLALHQLAHFASSAERGVEARNCLKISSHERRYFPFAATGVVLTSFCLDLLKENRMHVLLFDAIQRSYTTSPAQSLSAAGNAANMSRGVDDDEHDEDAATDAEARLSQQLILAIHDFYSDLYARFADLWVRRDPPNIMSFPLIFKEFQEAQRKRLRGLA